MNEQRDTIVVFGEALVDDFGSEQVVGGAPFNVARNLAALGAPALMITRIGEDATGELVRAEFARFGLSETGLQVDADKPTGRVQVERAHGEHRFTILPDQAYDRIDAAAALAAAAAVPQSTLYFGTLAQRDPCARAALQALFGASAARRFLDLNVRDGQTNERCVFHSLHEADIVKVNEEELQQLFSWYTHTQPSTLDMGEAGVRATCQRLMRTFALQGLIVTLGPRGSVYFGADGEVVEHVDTPMRTTLVDTVGAGDAYASVFLLGQARAWPLALTLARANEFAAAICGVSGAVPADLAFYQPFISRWLLS
jgi:fructokinase